MAFLLFLQVQIWKRMRAGRMRALTVTAVLLGGFILYRFLFDPAVAAIEGALAVYPNKVDAIKMGE